VSHATGKAKDMISDSLRNQIPGPDRFPTSCTNNSFVQLPSGPRITRKGIAPGRAEARNTKYETEDLAQRRRDAGGDRKGDWELRNSGIEELTDIVGVPDRIKPKSMVSRRGAGARGKARTKEGVSRNGATHAKKKNDLALRRETD
jgi:hypothetical protein